MKSIVSKTLPTEPISHDLIHYPPQPARKYGERINWPKNICLVPTCGCRPKEGGLCQPHLNMWLNSLPSTMDAAFNAARAAAKQEDRQAWAAAYVVKDVPVKISIPRVRVTACEFPRCKGKVRSHRLCKSHLRIWTVNGRPPRSMFYAEAK